MFRRKSIITILTAGMVLSSVAVYAQSNNGPNENAATAFDNKVIKKISADNMYDTIALLSEQPRAAGTEGELKAVKYIESQFKSLGFETKIQPFPIFDNVQIIKVKIGDSDLGGTVPRAFTNSVTGQVVTAPLVYVGKATPGEIGDVNGKIALIERGDIPFIDKVQNVLNKGAVGVLMYNNAPGTFTGQVNSGQKIPAVSITQDQGLDLVQKLKSGQLTATLDVGKVERVEKTSYNVIASLKPNKNKDTGQIVTIGAHHDSVPGGPGANDDASGVSAVLELARIFAKTPIDTEIRFLTFGSEERGLVGSSFYAKSLPKEDVDRMVAHFQMDMIGGRDAGANNPAGGLIMYTIDGKKNLVTDLGSASGARTMSEVIPYGKLGRSDHQPFHDLGIPSALFIHSPVEPWYHQPTDTIDKISKEKLQQAAEIVGASVYQIARPDTPALKVSRVAPGPVDYDFEDRPVQ